MFSLDGMLEGTCRLPFGDDLPAGTVFTMALADNIVHAWDLAVATGQDATMPDEIVGAAGAGRRQPAHRAVPAARSSPSPSPSSAAPHASDRSSPSSAATPEVTSPPGRRLTSRPPGARTVHRSGPAHPLRWHRPAVERSVAGIEVEDVAGRGQCGGHAGRPLVHGLEVVLGDVAVAPQRRVAERADERRRITRRADATAPARAGAACSPRSRAGRRGSIPTGRPCPARARPARAVAALAAAVASS